MFNSGLIVLAVAGLVVLSVGGILYALLYPMVSGNSRTEKRLEVVNRKPKPSTGNVRAATDINQRRRQVQDRLAELEEAQKAKAKKRAGPGLKIRLRQAGLNWSKGKFYVVSAICGAVFFVVAKVLGAPIYVAGGLAIVGLLGFPNWLIKFRRKRREKKFLNEFPNSVDVIVRGVKAGLPLGDCLGIIAREAQEPVRTEFQRILETQRMGIPLSEAVQKLPESMPLAEANFFAVVISIQQQAGGNLSEALSNLSKVLRDRKKLKGKIVAMSQEAKASAGIIGSLPIIVMALVYLTTPSYIAILFNETVGNIILGVSAFWMFIGIMVMRKMINFDF
ncbi:tight adherence protein B [Rhodobium orientis]|uniref:Pilus assembly protein n=1 Tax=Rhodobium orientis TaxID=34017 RepID=A0A327JNS0_9HYPH|nr:type II secretion system F family protein [Rhodobium orientis]MBB4304655.1 tight adherence protein B [Rhodobium orientis]MBK5950030.1 pilus assembly protein [Rhodobium orientis]RAI27721.1 pilus assembly protein [Rhodobium orientis]